MAPQSIELEASSYEEIVRQAMEQLGVTDEQQLRVEILEEGEKRNLLLQKKSFLRARVTANIFTGECDVVKFIKNIVQSAQLADDVEESEDPDGGLHLEIVGYGPENLQAGLEVLDALQHLGIRYFLRRGVQRRLTIDSQGLRSRRSDEMEDWMKKVHQSVVRGQKYVTDFLYPFERRQLHLAMKDLGGVKTMSRGNGLKKQVVILPLQRPRRSRDEAQSTENFN